MPLGSKTTSDTSCSRWPMRLGRPAAFPMAALLIIALGTDVAQSKTPGQTYCFLGRCHRVLTLAETHRQTSRTETLIASFYDNCARDRFNPCSLTSSGEAFRPDAPDNAASPIYPDGTLLLLFYRMTGVAAVVRVNNAGPYHSRRLLDVSRATAEAMGFSQEGLAQLDVRVLEAPRAEDATYRRNRRYWPVHGPIGRHASIAEAHEALVRVTAEAPIASLVDAVLPKAVTSHEPAVVTVAPPDAGQPLPDLLPELERGALEQWAVVMPVDPPVHEASTAAFVQSISDPAVSTSLPSPVSQEPRSTASNTGVEPGANQHARFEINAAAERLRHLPPAVQRRPVSIEPSRSPSVADDALEVSHPLSRFLPAIARGPAVELDTRLAPPPVSGRSRADETYGVVASDQDQPVDRGWFAALRASARRGAPARLPAILGDDGAGAVAWLRSLFNATVDRARTAARAGLDDQHRSRGQ